MITEIVTNRVQTPNLAGRYCSMSVIILKGVPQNLSPGGVGRGIFVMGNQFTAVYFEYWKIHAVALRVVFVQLFSFSRGFNGRKLRKWLEKRNSMAVKASSTCYSWTGHDLTMWTVRIIFGYKRNFNIKITVLQCNDHIPGHQTLSVNQKPILKKIVIIERAHLTENWPFRKFWVFPLRLKCKSY